MYVDVSRRTSFYQRGGGEGREPTSGCVDHDTARHGQLAPIQVGQPHSREVPRAGLVPEEAGEEAHGGGGDKGEAGREVIDMFGVEGDRGEADGVLDGEARGDGGEGGLGEGASEVGDVEEALQEGGHGGRSMTIN